MRSFRPAAVLKDLVAFGMPISSPQPEGAGSRPASTHDIGHLLDGFSWSLPQKIAVLLAALAIVIDGFDNQVVGFAVPALVVDWGLPRPAFGPVLGAGLVGMTCGAGVGGWFGDRFGRRLALIGSVFVFGVTTIVASFASGVVSLTVLRFLAGTGMGAALPIASTLAAEFTPLARRAFAVTVTIVCVPLGGMVAGLVAAGVLPRAGWRMLFVIGGVTPLALGLLLWLMLPESPRYLARRAARWPELVRLLARWGRPVETDATFVDAVEQRAEGRTARRTIFGGSHRRDTFALWGSFFCNLSAIYLVFSWLPALLTGEGLDIAASSVGLSAYNFGGVLGALSFAVLVAVTGSRVLMLAAVAGGLLSAVSLMAIPISPQNHQVLLVVCLGLHGFFVNSSQTAMYALAAHIYPTKVRATGSALAIALGRTGAILSALFGGMLIQVGRPAYFGMLVIAMAGTFVSLAVIRNHIPATRRAD